MAIKVPRPSSDFLVGVSSRVNDVWFRFLEQLGRVGDTLQSLSQGKIWIGDSTATPVEHAVSGDATLSTVGVLTLADDAVSNAKLSNMAADTVKGRAHGAGAGDPTDLTAAQQVSILNTATQYSMLAGGLVKKSVQTGVTATVPTDYQLVVANEFSIIGTGELVLVGTGELAVI